MRTFGIRLLCLGAAVILFGNSTSMAMTTREIRKAYSKSYTYEKVQDYSDAINALANVLRDSPSEYTVNLRLGWLYYLNRNYADSQQHYAKAMKSAPRSIEARLGLMLPLLAQGRYDQVETVAYHVLETDHYNYYANLRLAVALRLEKKYRDAGKILQQMLTLYPIDVSFLTQMGLVLQAEGKIEEAAKIFSKVLTLDPENPTAKAWLTRARDK